MVVAADLEVRKILSFILWNLAKQGYFQVVAVVVASVAVADEAVEAEAEVSEADACLIKDPLMLSVSVHRNID